MANADAFNQGFDAGQGKEGKKKKSNSNPKVFTPDDQQAAAIPKTFKKGGKVKRTGVAKVHKGEYVLTVKQAKKYAKKKGTRKRVSSKR